MIEVLIPFCSLEWIGSDKPLERRNSALSSGSEVGGVKPVLCQKLSKVFVSMVCSKASVMSMSTPEDV